MGDDSAIAFIDVDSSKKFQKILGFGGAFTEASAYNFYRLPKSMQEKVIQVPMCIHLHTSPLLTIAYLYQALF